MTVLKNIVSFVALAPGVPTSLPHGLIDAAGRGLIPDHVEDNRADVVVTAATATNVTVRNDGAAPVNCDVLCERWHSTPRALPAGQTDLSVQPFIPSTGATNGITSAAVIGDNKIVRGDGGGRGVQESLPEIDDAGNIHPPATNTLTVGTAARKFQSVNTQRLFATNDELGTAVINSPVGLLVARMGPNYQAQQSAEIVNYCGGAVGYVWKAAAYPGAGTAQMVAGSIYGSSFAAGNVVSFGAFDAILSATGYGGLATGSAYGSTADAAIRASGFGAVAHGVARGLYGATTIDAGGAGSFAHGYVVNASVSAGGGSAFAMGGGNGGGYAISAAGQSSFAFGNTDAASGPGDVIASAENCGQFGVGINALADSWQVGNAGIRLKGTVGAPAGLQNGDIWVDAGGNVLIRSGGANVVIV